MTDDMAKPLPARLEDGDSRAFLVEFSEALGTSPKVLWNVVKSACLQPDKDGRVATDEEVTLYLMVCRRYDLNPMLKEAYGFISKGRLQVGVGIDGWLKIANRDPQFDGLQVTDNHADDGTLLSCTATVWRKDRQQPIVLTEYLSECKQRTTPWAERPHRMLRHKATSQAIRYAFAITGISDIEEAREAVHAINAEIMEIPAPTGDEVVDALYGERRQLDAGQAPAPVIDAPISETKEPEQAGKTPSAEPEPPTSSEASPASEKISPPQPKPGRPSKRAVALKRLAELQEAEADVFREVCTEGTITTSEINSTETPVHMLESVIAAVEERMGAKDDD